MHSLDTATKQKPGAGAGPSGIGSKGAQLQCRFGSTPGLACQQPAKAAPLFPGAKANTKKVGQNSHWDGSEPTSAVAGQRPAFATAASASPESASSQGSSIARGQCLTVVAKDVVFVLLGNQRQQMPDSLDTSVDTAPGYRPSLVRFGAPWCAARS